MRIIAATNQNLEVLIENGRFRKDLYYRLRGVTLHLPPLRDRRDDIAELAHYFLFRFNRELGNHRAVDFGRGGWISCSRTNGRATSAMTAKRGCARR